jgi:NAD/NADP octopine/nopaline dehydrogenase, alpha-helical domain
VGCSVAGSSSPTSRRQPSVITICGGGNAGHALAVVASQNFEGHIDWLVGSEEKAELLRRGVSAKGLRSTGRIVASADRLRTISADPGEVIPEANLVMIVVPAYVHAGVLGRIAPHVSDSTAIGCLPTRGGFEFEAAKLVAPNGKRPTIFGLQTLPWSTRVVTPGEVSNIGAVKAEVVVAALPAREGDNLAAQLSRILATSVIVTEPFLNLTLANPGQLIHPGLMYGHFHAWNGEEYEEETIPMFYAEATDEMGEVVERLSEDVIRVASAIASRTEGVLDLRAVAPVHEWLRASYSHVTDDTSTVGSCFRTGPIQARKAPVLEVGPGKFVPNFEYRYLTEDVPYGLVVTKSLAEIVGVATPMIDEVVSWAQDAMKRVYLVGGRLEGPDAATLPIPQRHGIQGLSDLMEWYRDEAPLVDHSRGRLGV